MLAAWKGAEVFPNGNTTGDCDLMLRIDGVIYQLDVKVSTFLPEKNYWQPKNTWNVREPVFPCVVEPDGDIANWRVRWLPHRTPTGLEEFWSKDYRTVSTKPTA